MLTGSATAKEAIVETTEGDLIPASPRLYKVKYTEKDRLRRAIKPILSQYDFILLDTAPARDSTLITAMIASDSVIIPCEARLSSLDGLLLIYGTIQNIQQTSNQNLKVRGILITKCKPRTNLTQDMRENLKDMAEELKIALFNSEIRDCNALAEAEALHQSIYKHAPRSNAAKDYSALIEELLEGSK